VLGGLCLISATLGPAGEILHLNDTHGLTFGAPGGESDGTVAARVHALEQALAPANFDSAAAGDIVQQMWEKWVFIASLAGMTCLLRGSVGDIGGAAANDLSLALLAECGAIAGANGYAPREAAMQRAGAILTAPGSPMSASMFKDMQRGAPTEAEHILGDLLARQGWSPPEPSLLRVAYAHLRVYELQRAARLVEERARA